MPMHDTTASMPVHRATLFWAGALPWTLVGVGLLLLGSSLVARSNLFAEQPLAAGLLVGSALLAGWLKGRLVLAKAADRTLQRAAAICGGTLGQRVFAALGARALVLVLAMMLLGYAVRHSGLPPGVRGWICLAIGFALLWSSVRYWRVLFGQGRP